MRKPWIDSSLTFRARLPVLERMIPITPELRDYALRKANFASVKGELHEQDFILQFLLGNPCFPNAEGAVDYYLREGEKSAVQLAQILFQELGLKKDPDGSILEFAAGYGCVTRHLRGCLAPWQVISSDIHTEANAFNAAHFAVETLQSTTKPADFPRGRKFQAVFALSFFSHMPLATWSHWLRALWDCVADGGFLIFTTQGMASRQYLGNPVIPENGFWFHASSEQSDLSTQDYGQTIVTIPFVLDQVRTTLPSAYPRLIRPGYWWVHQDLFVIGRLPQAG